MKMSQDKLSVPQILESERRQLSRPEVSKRIREGGDAVRERLDHNIP